MKTLRNEQKTNRTLKYLQKTQSPCIDWPVKSGHSIVCHHEKELSSLSTSLSSVVVVAVAVGNRVVVEVVLVIILVVYVSLLILKLWLMNLELIILPWQTRGLQYA